MKQPAEKYSISLHGKQLLDYSYLEIMDHKVGAKIVWSNRSSYDPWISSNLDANNKRGDHQLKCVKRALFLSNKRIMNPPKNIKLFHFATFTRHN